MNKEQWEANWVISELEGLLKRWNETKVSKSTAGVGWEIVSFLHKKDGIFSKKDDFYLNEERFLANPDMVIHSVKRLSDGQEFTLGDILDASTDLSGANYNIGSFYVNGNIIIASPDKEMRGYSIKDWRKAAPVKEVLFTTETVFEEYADEPKFPCLFVPMTMDRKNEWYFEWDKADIVEYKIRGAGHYFKINSIVEKIQNK